MKKLNTSDFKYHFPSLKFYIAALTVLILLSLFSWLPSTEIDLFIVAEPLIINFEIKLDASVSGLLFNLDTIGAKVINSQDKEDWPGYRFVDNLADENDEKIIIFLDKDLRELVDYKIKKLLNEQKCVFEFHPEEWDIEVLNKNLLTGRGVIRLALQEEVIRIYDLESLKQEVILKKLEFVREELGRLPGVRSVRIEPRPWFYRRMPLFPNRIHISYQPA